MRWPAYKSTAKELTMIIASAHQGEIRLVTNAPRARAMPAQTNHPTPSIAQRSGGFPTGRAAARSTVEHVEQHAAPTARLGSNEHAIRDAPTRSLEPFG